jgi:hypothetical protein
MAIVAIVSVNGGGDIGGNAISRFAICNNAQTNLSGSEGNAAGAAVHGFYSTLSGNLANNYTWTVNPTWQEFVIATGVIDTVSSMSSPPAQVIGGGTGNYPGGNGARVNLHTTLVINRRLLRGALFFTPLNATSYDASGDVASSVRTAIVTAYNAYSAALVAAGLTPVVWHRPRPSSPSAGVVMNVNTASVGSQPGSLRSRRS